MRKYFNLKNAGILILAVLAVICLWNMRPQGIETVMKEWREVNKAWVVDMSVYADDGDDRTLTDAEFARFKEIMESATFKKRYYAGDTMYGNLYGVYLFKDGKTHMDQSLNMRIFPSSEGYIYIGDCYRYFYDKHDEMWAFIESLDI